MKKTVTKVASAPNVDWRKGGSRDKRTALIRAALFRAGVEVVGEEGYEKASVARITQRAGVANGTFYNHFASRQAFFDQLLPTLGRDLLEHVRTLARSGGSVLEREELGFRAFFSFLGKVPHFFRILNEAETFAPTAYREHLQLVTSGYTRFFKRAKERGELTAFQEHELEVIALVLMSARTYIAWHYLHDAGEHDELPESVVRSYVKFLKHGLEGCGFAQETRAPEGAFDPPQGGNR